MSLGHSPKIVTDGLKFYYDMANVQKSWKGQPISNGSGTGNIYTNWNNSGTATWVNNDTSVPRVFSDVQVNSMYKVTAGNSHIGVGYYPLVNGATHTVSCYVYIPSNAGTLAGSAPYFRSFPANTSRGTLRYNGSTNWNAWPRDQWIRISTTWTNTAADTYMYISCYLDTVGNKIYMTAPQGEQNTYASAFVNGTRSNTQALVDMTGNYTLTVNSLSYNSDGTFKFAGSHNIDLNSTNVITGTDPFTIESWTNLTSGSYGAIFGNYGTGYTSGTLWWATAGLFINGSVYHSSYTTTMAGVHHAAVTRDSAGNVKLYRDGVLVGSGTLTSSIPAQQNFRIGTDVNGTGEAMNGDIYSVKVYDRVLTADEINQNFNASRSRFGV